MHQQYGPPPGQPDASKKFLNMSGGVLILVVTGVIVLCCLGPCLLGLFGGVVEGVNPTPTP